MGDEPIPLAVGVMHAAVLRLGVPAACVCAAPGGAMVEFWSAAGDALHGEGLAALGFSRRAGSNGRTSLWLWFVDRGERRVKPATADETAMIEARRGGRG